ncbi:MAG: hypothetical protein EZS28_056412, partial [Streblomastix strix]
MQELNQPPEFVLRFVKLHQIKLISDACCSSILTALPLPVNVESTKSVYEILILDETVFMKCPDIGFFASNPENIVLLLAVPLIINCVHAGIEIDTAAEPELNLFSVNSHPSIVHQVTVPQQTIHPLLSPLNDPFLNVELTILTDPFVANMNGSI